MNRYLNRTTTAVAIAITAFALGACNDSYGDAESSAPQNADRATSKVDPCGLVEQPLLEGALGTALESTGPAVPAAQGDECSWTFVDDLTGLDGSLSITTWHGAEFFTDLVGEPAAGLGDEARTDPGLGVVLFRVGDEVVQVQTLPSSHVQAARQIADLAVEGF